MDDHSNARAHELVSAHLQRATGWKRGALRRMRQESGVLMLIGIALTSLALLATFPAVGPLNAVLILGLAFGPAIPIAGLGLWLDRNEPEPAWLLLRSFIWGACIATLVASVINSVVALSAGMQAAAVVSAPIVEEACKGLALLWVLRRFDEHLNGRLDATIYALFIGLGFAVVENVQYYLDGWTSKGVQGLAALVVVRGIMTPFLHPLFTMMTGWGIIAGLRRSGVARASSIALGYAGAVLLHATWNSGVGLILYVPIGIPLFIWLTIRTVRASKAEHAQLRYAVDRAQSTGLLPIGTAVACGIGTKPRLLDVLRAARDPEHPYHSLWQARSLAWIMSSPPAAAQIAIDDPLGQITPEQVQVAAREMLASQIARPPGPPVVQAA